MMNSCALATNFSDISDPEHSDNQKVVIDNDLYETIDRDLCLVLIKNIDLRKYMTYLISQMSETLIHSAIPDLNPKLLS